ncbi:hypothetical protein ACFLT7_00775 [candidate division KSB1 bacterium]
MKKVLLIAAGFGIFTLVAFGLAELLGYKSSGLYLFGGVIAGFLVLWLLRISKRK